MTDTNVAIELRMYSMFFRRYTRTAVHHALYCAQLLGLTVQVTGGEEENTASILK